MAAKGYAETHARVRSLIGLDPSATLKRDFSQWYVTLFSPSVSAGEGKRSGRVSQPTVYPEFRTAAPEAVRDCMPALFAAAGGRAPGRARGIRSFHLRVHPPVHGRQWPSRFLMNYLLTTGGMTIVTVHTDWNIGLIESQAAEPIERITQRPEAGSWTALPPASN
jgi:hypothetical protein